MTTALKLTYSYDLDGFKPFHEHIFHQPHDTLGNQYPCHITDPTVQLHQFTITYTYPKYYLHEASTSGTFIRLPPNQLTRIPYGTWILCGSTFIDTSNPKLAKVIDQNYTEISSFDPVYGYEYIFGRGIGGETIVNSDDAFLSRNHAKVIFYKSFIKIMDWKDGQGSSNGTFINIANKQEIKGSCLIRLGLTTFCKIETIAAPIRTSSFSNVEKSTYVNATENIANEDTFDKSNIYYDTVKYPIPLMLNMPQRPKVAAKS